MHLRRSDAVDVHPIERHLGAMIVVQAGDQHISGRRIDHIPNRDCLVVRNPIARVLRIFKPLGCLVRIVRTDRNRVLHAAHADVPVG
jgi:hypothetical protein